MTNSYSGFKVRPRPPAPARAFPAQPTEFLLAYARGGEASIAEAFKGITTDGKIVPGLFPIQTTGVSTRPIREAAEAFLSSLGAQDRARTLFPVEGETWRRWSNIHPFVMRHGMPLEDMSASQRDLALGLLRTSLSRSGFETARDVMKLNDVIREITGRDEEYGEWLYWLSVMGTPSAEAPWGWQIDGHHLIVNCFVLGDQVVMTPMFMGSEPVEAESGPHAGTRVFEAEEEGGLTLMRALTPAQQDRTVLSRKLPNEVFTAAFRDNFELRLEGICYDELSTTQQGLLVQLAETYVERVRPGHARVRMDEVMRHLGETHFAWIGDTGADAVFYYRIHSPVILIEFDHQRGIAFDNDAPSRNHVHTVVRTPNGNDYGRDLLRQHHERFAH
jgi:hypothetical protein